MFGLVKTSERCRGGDASEGEWKITVAEKLPRVTWLNSFYKERLAFVCAHAASYFIVNREADGAQQEHVPGACCRAPTAAGTHLCQHR